MRKLSKSNLEILDKLKEMGMSYDRLSDFGNKHHQSYAHGLKVLEKYGYIKYLGKKKYELINPNDSIEFYRSEYYRLVDVERKYKKIKEVLCSLIKLDDH